MQHNCMLNVSAVSLKWTSVHFAQENNCILLFYFTQSFQYSYICYKQML